MLRTILVGIITAYQRTLSPDHGALKGLYPYGYCRHEPTCSEYAKLIITERGVLRGILLALRRVMTCHPWRKPSDERILKVLVH